MKLITCLLSVCALSTCGCATQGVIPPAHQQVAYSTAKPRLNTVNIIDNALQTSYLRPGGAPYISTKLAVEGAGQSVVQTGAREVWVTLRNLTDYPQNVEIRVTWYDAAERPVDGPTAWKRIFIPSNGAETFTSPSVHSASNAFYVEVRELG